jgi:hypothetical protein
MRLCQNGDRTELKLDDRKENGGLGTRGAQHSITCWRAETWLSQGLSMTAVPVFARLHGTGCIFVAKGPN